MAYRRRCQMFFGGICCWKLHSEPLKECGERISEKVLGKVESKPHWSRSCNASYKDVCTLQWSKPSVDVAYFFKPQQSCLGSSSKK
nr:tyrosyl-DNA phosphodiesterase 1 isoform X2 [Ipomoea batatas]